MAKKSKIKKEFEKVRRMADRDPTLSEIIKQVAEVEGVVKGVSKGEVAGRFRTPYVDAVPMKSTCWAK
jgi:hypothetical protein